MPSGFQLRLPVAAGEIAWIALVRDLCVIKQCVTSSALPSVGINNPAGRSLPCKHFSKKHFHQTRNKRTRKTNRGMKEWFIFASVGDSVICCLNAGLSLYVLLGGLSGENTAIVIVYCLDCLACREQTQPKPQVQLCILSIHISNQY